jgi:hypothetical protein
LAQNIYEKRWEIKSEKKPDGNLTMLKPKSRLPGQVAGWETTVTTAG